MPITHEEAHRLIQFNADQALKEVEKNLLEDHLTACLECRDYARRMQDLELTLTSVMQRRWNNQSRPRPIQATGPKKHSKLLQNTLFATRIAAMGVICIAFLFNILHFTQSAGQSPNPISASVPPVPTPSVLSTTTNVTGQQCKQISYTVQDNDTLESIAGRFSVPMEVIVAANHLQANLLYPSMNLSIPICDQTPGTPRTATITFTPLLDSTTSTPVNSPTQ